MTEGISAPTAAHSDPATSGTPITLQCYCGRAGCDTPEDCRREYMSSETGWREVAARRPRWNLPTTAVA